MTKVVVLHSCTETRLHSPHSIKGVFRADIGCWYNQNNPDQGRDFWYVGPDLFVPFEKINDIMQCITHAFTLPDCDRTLPILISEFIGYQSQTLISYELVDITQLVDIL